eukprot:scaffold25809_cov22-Tisochrysis_lutea.AAC.1
MEDMEECMGGGKKGFAFELGTYERRMLEYDADVEAELSHMAKGVKGDGGGGVGCMMLQWRQSYQDPVFQHL